MKLPIPKYPLTAKLAVLSAAFAAVVNISQAQVTLSQVTNGLVSYYPLDFVQTNGSTITTPDFVSARDMILVNMNGNNAIASTRPSANPASVTNCLNFDQQASGVGNTLMYYDAKAQNQVTGGGDFLPFCNQINATMSFWIKRTANTGVNAYSDKRFFGECDASSGQSGPIWLIGTSSAGGLPTDANAHFLLRQKNSSPGPDVPDPLVDGTFEIPNLANHWVQGANYTTNSPLDGNWHMFTITVDSNRVYDVYIDGVRDAGPGTFTDMYGNPAYGLAIPLTNIYYTTNLYPGINVSNPPPNGYVRWLWNATFRTGATAFGGFRRNGANTGGFPMLLDDIAFWNRKLSTDEIEFVRTNGLYGIPISRPLQVNSFTADLAEVGKGDFVTLRWNVLGALTNSGSGGIVISGVGDVSSIGPIGSVNAAMTADQTTFTLTIHNGIAADTNSTVTVKGFGGVVSDWHLIQRFDGVFADSDSTLLGGVNGNNWVSAASDFSGQFDKWNVMTITNSGAVNKVISPRTGYNPIDGGVLGYQSRGALSYGKLGSLAMVPNTTNTLFFRFSLQEPVPNQDLANDIFLSDLDFGVGLSDYGFIGPSAGLGYYGGTGGGFGPYFSIIRNAGGNFTGGPFNLFAPDLDEASGTTTNTFNYTTLNPNGLDTNVNYLVWMDIENYNTHAATNGSGGSNTVNEAQYSVWIQKQGEPTRTQLFTNFHGNRNYVGFNAVNDNPVPILDKVFFNIGSESIDSATNTPGSYITTNMIAIDDIYFSKSGKKGSVPRLFDLTSIVKASSSVTLTWDSLGSLFGTNTYTIQRKTDLQAPAWTTLGTIPSGGGTTTYTDNTIGAASAAYYRIVWP